MIEHSVPPEMTTSATIAVAQIIGPTVGSMTALVFAAAVGGLLALSKAEVKSVFEGVRHVLLSVMIAVVLTSAGVWLVQHYTPLPANLALMPVAFFIAASRDFLIGFIQGVWNAAIAFLTTRANKG